MQADEVRHEDPAGATRARSGPRHAAPRKPLLTRLQMPAGKAIALAAMPSAVLMGMGLTPTLAQAKPGVPKNPFQDGPCVTAPDEASKDVEKEAKDAEDAKKAEDAEDAEKKAGQGEDAKGETGEKGGGAGDTDAAGKDSTKPAPSTDPDAGEKAGNTPSGDADDKDQAAEPAPEPSKPKNPLDPLGLGDALKDVFTPDDKDSPDRAPAPAASEETKSPKDTAKDTTDKVTEPADDAKDTVDGTGDRADKAKDKAGDTAGDAAGDADKAGGLDDEAGKAAEGADGSEDEGTTDPMAPDADGKKPFPCVVEKKVDGEAEETPVRVADEPWELEASSLLLKGLDYKGVVNLTTAGGKKKQALKFTVDNGTDIGDLHQIAPGPDGTKYHIRADEGSTSTIRDGQTVMYTERLQGNLFGLIPIVFDPEHPPPLNIPVAYFTKVKVVQAAQFGGTLKVPGLEQTITR
ncbi:hypothetical protein ABZY36_11330 [Streptomyces sp. NPDC006627]|uniref:hypothetical protein n=1 Tax=Streptomyces sp. NPDC006627 TaxID=3154679 RepID=UPI0033A90750